MKNATSDAKRERIIANELARLFSRKAFLMGKSIEDLLKLHSSHPTVELNGQTHFLSQSSIDAIEKLIAEFQSAPSLNQFVDYYDVSRTVYKLYRQHIKLGTQPNAQEFASEVKSVLQNQIKPYKFIAIIEGLELVDLDAIEFGKMCIVRANSDYWQQLPLPDYLSQTDLRGQLSGPCWIVGETLGTRSIAYERFAFQAQLVAGALALYGCLIYKGALTRSRIRACTSPFEHRQAGVHSSY